MTSRELMPMTVPVAVREGIKVETPISTLVLFGWFLAFWAVQLAGRA